MTRRIAPVAPGCLPPARLRGGAHRLALLASLVVATPSAAHGSGSPPDFGPNVIIFDPSMPTSQIQATVDAIAAQQVPNQFGSERFALLFKPGVYGSVAEPLIVQVGYYTEVAGLGRSPGDVVINGHVDVYNQCGPNGCFALVNFWRSLSNLTIQVTGLSDCRASANFWAVSQASPMRRVEVRGGTLSLMDYCTAGPQFASGGFIADSRTGAVINGSQQQFLVRDSEIGNWSNGVWNQVFAGAVGAPPTSFPNPTYTTLDTNPVSRERPYLYVDASNRYHVFVPDPRRDSAGTTWANGPTPGRSIPLSQFYLATPSDSPKTINKQLSRGKHLIFTPGVYGIERTLKVKRANTIVLGLGLATLTAVNGATPMTVADVEGVDIAGLMFDAGDVESPVLLQIGRRHGGRCDGDTPTALQDIFFRIGGPDVGKAKVSLEVNTDGVILDHIWAWRADHGAGVGWDLNTADTGVVINGDHVTATGLFVEHYQKYNLIWNGDHGTTIMFQNELPYDPPDQAAWQHDGILGWAAYKVSDDVANHTLIGGGAYVFTNVNPTLHATRGFEVPTTPGIRLQNILTVNLGAGTIDHVVNDTGEAVTTDDIGVPSTVLTFP